MKACQLECAYCVSLSHYLQAMKVLPGHFKILPCILAVIFQAQAMNAENGSSLFDKCMQEGGQDITDDICRPKGYLYTQIPSSPLKINATFVFHGIHEVNDKSMIVSLELTFSIRWTDPRLIGKFLNQSTEPRHGKMGKNGIEKHIWKPNLHIHRLFKFEAIGIEHSHDVFLYLVEGQAIVTMSMHAIVQVKCQMNFKYFPFDTQDCHFTLGTDSGTQEEIQIESQFLSKRLTKYSEFDVEILSHKEERIHAKFLDAFNLKHPHQEQKYSTAGLNIILKRNWRPYMGSYFMPVFLMSLICSISFIISPDMIPGRIALLLTLVLVLINSFNGLQEQIPSSEVGAIGLYLLGIIFLVSMAIFEYAYMLLRLRRRQRQETQELISQEAKKVVCWQSTGNNAALKDFNFDQKAFFVYNFCLALFHAFFVAYINNQ